VSLDFEVDTNVSCEESTVSFRTGLIFGACCVWPLLSPPPNGWRNSKGKGQFWGCFPHWQCIVQHRPQSGCGLAHRGRSLISTIALLLLVRSRILLTMLSYILRMFFTS